MESGNHVSTGGPSIYIVQRMGFLGFNALLQVHWLQVGGIN